MEIPDHFRPDRQKDRSASVSPAFDGDDIYWLEMRPKEGGRNVIVKREQSTGVCTDVTHPSMPARAFHEYGGGDYCTANGVVYFSNFSDQRLYRQEGI
jgi:hypothetical protein